MTEDQIDLSPLDPDADPVAEGRFVDAVMARVVARPQGARLHIDPLIGVWSIMRSPALAAGIVIAVAVGALGLRMKSSVEAKPVTVAEALGVPAEFLATGNGR